MSQTTMSCRRSHRVGCRRTVLPTPLPSSPKHPQSKPPQSSLPCVRRGGLCFCDHLGFRNRRLRRRRRLVQEAASQESAADSATSGDETSTAGELAPAASEDTSTSFDSSSNDASEDAAASSEYDPTIGRPASPDAEGSALEAPAFRMVVDFSPA